MGTLPIQLHEPDNNARQSESNTNVVVLENVI